MRKLLISAALFLAVTTSFAQQWGDIGIKGGYGYNLLFNSNLINDKDFQYDHSFGYSFGGKIGWNFSYNNEVVVEFMSTHFNQDLKYNADGNSGTLKYAMHSYDIPLIYRSNNEKTGSYAEIGPQFSIVQGVMESDLGDVSDNFNGTYWSVVVGLGNYVAGTDNTGLVAGVRLMYALGDVINGTGKDNGYPTGAFGDGNASEKSTNPFTALFMLELNHDFGYLVSASCQQRNKLILFGL
ncbi:MAG: outer membrane beta-barrel protein [Flavobacteriales bacterium]|nr:outer membrane beta-barrel protein [Flavobacteriales bacterium]